VTRVLLPLRIAWRFLTSSPVQSAIIAAGISVGIATQIFVGSIIFSLQDSLLATTIGSAPQVTIQAIKESDPVRLTPEMRKILATDPRVKPGTVVPIRSAPALYSNGSDSASLGLLGGNLSQLEGIYKLSARTVEGHASLGQGEIMLGRDFAEKFGIKAGDSISLKFQNDQTGSFKVTGIFDLGAAQFNLRNAFVSAQTPQNVLGWSNDQYTQVQLQLKQPYDSVKVAEQWAQELPGVSVIEWQGQNKDLLAGLVGQTVSSYMIQAFVLVAVALGIASTLAISAVQKTRQIGILKAMGLSDASSGQVFLYQAAILGVAGSLGGIVVSFVLLWLFELSPAPVTITIQPSFVAISATIGVVVAVTSSIIPIRSTSRLDPIEVIQNG
jgi:lipoprotein-releasing system permease protein